MQDQPEAPPHPILACASLVEAAVKDVTDVQPVFMTTPEKAEALLRLGRVADQVAALRLRVLAVAGDVAEAEAARDMASWLAHHTRIERPAARRDTRLATDLEDRWHALAAAFGQGRVNTAQVRVIARVLAELPEDLDPEILALAEEELIVGAEEFSPRELETLGRRILEVVAPDIAEAEEGKKLAAEEQRARETTTLTSKRLGDGSTRISIRLPDATAARLQTYLEAFTAPRKAATSRLGDPAPDSDLPPARRTPMPRKLGQAFTALLETLDPKRLPLHGGDATTVMVTLDFATLTTALGAAGVATSTHPDGQLRISATEARRLACTATLIPAVLGSTGEVLDQGRAQRLFTPAQRKALALRDRICRAEGCTTPATWCEAHHLQSWTLGGNTDLTNGILLCSHHHHKAHDDRYTTTRMPNGDLRYRRRT